MKIVQIVPGSGNTFYCQNCMRDNSLVTALKNMGHDVVAIPMYLPLFVDDNTFDHDVPVFYGAINTYLKQVLPIYRKAPVWLERLLDSRVLLDMAAKKAGSTNAAGLEDMTISMLNGEDGNQSTELEHLVNWLRDHAKPDIVHLSNALLLGLAGRIKEELGVKIVCSLQDEHQWIDPMHEDYRDKVWDLMAEKAEHVDAFFPVSRYYSDRMHQAMRIPRDKLHVVHLGHNLDGYMAKELPFDPPVIGYLSRFNDDLGLDILVDAFIALKKNPQFRQTQLHLCGGYTTDDKQFYESQRKKLEIHNHWSDVRVYEHFDKASRLEFLSNITVLSVPVPGGEAFGSYLIEAFASGVPVVQPNTGAYPEIIEMTGGGLVYNPNTADELCMALGTLLSSPQNAAIFGQEARNKSIHLFDIEKMAAKMINIYHTLV